MLFNARKTNEYVAGDGPVRYLDGSSLARPLDLPRKMLPIAIALLVAAAIIGGFMLTSAIGGLAASTARSQASVEENLSRPVALDLPALPSLVGLDDAAIKQTFADAGYTIYDRTPEGEEGGGIDLIKLPSDVGMAEAALLYGKGISNLSASEAALVLNGSWSMEVDRRNGVNMSVKYADFASGGIEAAIDAAIAAEGLDPAAFSAAANDEAGNTYREGEVSVEGGSYTCRVSAIALSSVYDVDELPESAVYVGIRLS